MIQRSLSDMKLSALVRRSPSKAWYVKPFPLTPLSVPGNGFYHRYGLSCAYKKTAVENTNVEFVSLDGITDNKAYYSGLGTTVYDEDGNVHVVEHDGVAKHPGDKGMQAIADAIITVLDQ